MLFVDCLFVFSNNFFKKKKKYFRNVIRLSNILNTDKARHFVGPDLKPNCLQRLSADFTTRQGVTL